MTEQQYNECVHAHADGVFRFIVKNLRHEEDAKDVVQTAFEKLWRNRETVDASTAKSFLFTIAYNQMIDHTRKAKRTVIQDDFTHLDGTTAQPTAQLKKTLQLALNQLNETQRSLVMLKDYEGYNYQEIGEIMNLSESQVKVYLHRARTILKNFIVKRENVL